MLFSVQIFNENLGKIPHGVAEFLINAICIFVL